MRGYFYLSLSILFEVIGSTFLKMSQGFTEILPSVLLVLFYGLSFTVFVFALKTISLSVGYSIWAGVGTAGTALIGVLLFKEVLSGVNVLGLAIIIAGVIVINLGKKDDESEVLEG